ncbi:HIT-like protein [Hypoxylon sp. FL1284]|nr:HIT-like protein [Hypoxylon sp. FL1284]
MLRKPSSHISKFLFSSAIQKQKRTMGSQPASPLHFGPFEVTSQVFLTTPYSFALVNLKPLLPGHVLVCPRTPHRRLTELGPAELTDLFQAVQRVQRMLARRYFAVPRPAAEAEESYSSDGSAVNDSDADADGIVAPDGTPDAGSFNIAVQDGHEAGQTVAHLHVHVIPRIRYQTAKNGEGPGDKIYEWMAAEDGNVGGALWDREVKKLRSQLGSRPEPGGGFPSIEDSERHPRTTEIMEAEAEEYRTVLRQMDEE